MATQRDYDSKLLTDTKYLMKTEGLTFDQAIRRAFANLSSLRFQDWDRISDKGFNEGLCYPREAKDDPNERKMK
jgi:hypothetical protein